MIPTFIQQFFRGRTLAFQCAALFFAAVVLGYMRQSFPHGISWFGRWPTASTSAQEAYAMMAEPDDPAFVSLQEVQKDHFSRRSTFVDARSVDEFDEGHIPRAVNLPFYELDEKKEKALSGIEKNTPLIIYCEGVGCELSLFLGRELKKDGYTDMRIFYGGFPEWRDAGLPIEKTNESPT